MKLLLVEDDVTLVKALSFQLEKEGHIVDALHDGAEASRRIQLNHSVYDLIILDLMLPGATGFDICRSARESGIYTPVLILTGNEDVDDKVEALGLGADDYLTKPFSTAELVARIKALSRRPKTMAPKRLQVGDVVVDLDARRVYKGEREITLSLKEFGVLEYFASRPNQVVERDQILDHVWDFNFSSLSNVVDVHIHSLRKKLYPENKHALETIRGVGYRLNV